MLLRLKHKIKIPFKDWIRREYLNIHVHPWHQLAFDLNGKWKDFPVNTDATEKTFDDLSYWLYEHGACATCQANFKGAWMNYLNDVC